MKKILYILSLLIISFGVNAQVNKWDVNLKNIGSTQEKAVARGGLRADSAFDPPLRDTNYHPLRAGAFVYQPGSNKYWGWNGVKWVGLVDTITGGPQVNSDWNAVTGVAEILNKPNFATVAFTGSYIDLSNKPSIPAAQINSDWNANTTLAQILNRPRLVDSVYKPNVDSIAIILRGADNTLRTYKLSVGSSTAAGTLTQLNQGYGIVLTPSPITSVGLVAADTNKVVAFTDTLSSVGVATQTMLIKQLSSMSSVDFIIGDGNGGTPVAGTTVYTNAALQHSVIVGVFHEGQKVPNREVRGTIYVTTDTTAGTVTLHNGVFADSTYWSIVYRGPFIPSGTGTNLTLTTTGNTGASTLVGSTLNIPNYTITLTHTGTSGNATLVAGTLNIPNYTFALTNGNGTTASGTSVGLGGTLSSTPTISEGTNRIIINGTEVSGYQISMNSGGFTAGGIDITTNGTGVNVTSTATGGSFTGNTGVSGNTTGGVGVSGNATGGASLAGQFTSDATVTCALCATNTGGGPPLILQASGGIDNQVGNGIIVQKVSVTPAIGDGIDMIWAISNVGEALFYAVATDVGVSTYSTDYHISLANAGVNPSTPGQFVFKSNGIFQLLVDPLNFTNNAAAITGGLTAGMIYRNGDVLQIVH